MKGKAKKIVSISIIAVVLALTIATIVLAVVPVSLYNPVQDGYKAIYVYRDAVSNVYLNGSIGTEEQNKICSELMELHEESLKDNALSNLFQGTAGFEATVVNSTYQNLKSTFNADTKLCLVFDYMDNEQTLKINGEEYRVENITSSKPVKFNKAYMPINNSESFEECTLYLANSDDTSSYQVKFLAHQKDLYDYIIKMTMSQIKTGA